VGARRDAGVLEISVMAAIKVAVLRLSGTENYGRVSATVMCFPTASSGVVTAVLPDKFLPATFTVAACIGEGSLYLVRTVLVIVRHKLKNP
jgi:hypothetical protein